MGFAHKIIFIMPTKITELTNKEAKQNSGHFLIFAVYQSRPMLANKPRIITKTSKP
jgi:hypothetical protein